MTKTQVEAVSLPIDTESDPSSETKTDKKDETKKKRQPPYAVILHNDDLNSMQFVVGVLIKVFHHSRMKAVWLMLQAHVKGRSIVWTGSKEVAELKAEQLKSCGADPSMVAHGASTLRVTIEPLPE